jgi:hypothetical protein
MKLLFLILVVIAATLAGCGSPDPLSIPTGPWQTLNPTHWQPAESDQAEDEALPK